MKVALVLALFLLGIAWASCAPTPALWAKMVRYASGFGVDPLLLYALVWEESRFCVNARGAKGEVGLGQVRPVAAKQVGVPAAYLSDPDWNLYATAKYLRYLYDRYRDWEKALVAYNGGPSRLDSGNPPASSRQYARRILSTYRLLRQWVGGSNPSGPATMETQNFTPR